MEKNMHEIATHLNCPVYMLSPEINYSHYMLSIYDKAKGAFCPIDFYKVRKDDERDYKHILDTLRHKLDLTDIHIHHLKGHVVTGLKSFLKDNPGVNSIVSFHDLFLIKAIFGDKAPDIIDCNDYDNCSDPNSIRQKIKELQHNNQSLFDKVKKMIFFSRSTLGIFNKTYKIDNRKVEIIEHAITPLKQISIPAYSGIKEIVYFGRICEDKGIDIIYKIAGALPNINFHLLGVSEKQILKKANIINHGAYIVSELSDKIQAICPQFVICPTVWPETFSYVVSEAISMGVPLLVTPIGAPQERVNKHKIGYVAPRNDPDAYVDLIKKLQLETTESAYFELVDRVHNCHLIDFNQMIQLYKLHYSDQICADHVRLTPVKSVTSILYSIISMAEKNAAIKRVVKKFVNPKSNCAITRK